MLVEELQAPILKYQAHHLPTLDPSASVASLKHCIPLAVNKARLSVHFAIRSIGQRPKNPPIVIHFEAPELPCS